MHYLVVTADDFGLSDETNAGIVKAHLQGIVTSTSLLLNGPKTQEAIALAKAYPSLEVGIHLGFVEGYCLTKEAKTLTDSLRYFPDRPCLHRHWRPFLSRYLTGRIDLDELKRELEAQCQAYLTAFPEKSEIPFANGTQHLHLLPKIAPLVTELCHRYRIRYLRAPTNQGIFRRFPYGGILGFLGKKVRETQGEFGKVTDDFWGFEVSGHVHKNYLKTALAQLPSQGSPLRIELMVHPGLEAPHLRSQLPWAYQDFDWVGELEALTDPEVKAFINQRGLNLTSFRDLPS